MITPPLRSSPERIRRIESSGVLNQVPEDAEPAAYRDGPSFQNHEDDVDWELEEELELEEQGFYRGSYKRLVALYTLAPLTALVAIVLLSLLPAFAYRCPNPHPPEYPYLPFLPFPLPELLAPVALYALSYLLRAPLYALSALLLPFPLPAILLCTVLHTIISTLTRLLALALLLVRPYASYSYPTWHDPAFCRVWWVALGWAAAEAVVSVHQGYVGLALYQDVLVPPDLPLRDPERTPLLPTHHADSDPDIEIDHDIEQLIALKAREELEDVFGIPLVLIPAFIPCLQRINSVLLSLGLFLLLGASLYSANHSWLLVVLAAATHLLLAVLHAPIVLPRVGVQGAVYVGAVVSLGVLFAGLGAWGGVS
ncbi:hypothetical protein B0H10DRAFT_566900 [Mycena sp. CBHHK59/15]|nr:hypothetical protein B0H10DRAFT_566900 [Mycena sp. CBHHK59/15]